MKLIFIRHAEPDYSIDSLTKKGWKEAELLGMRVAKWPDITQIYCSPLGRAKDTASFTLKALQREAVVYDWLKEFHCPVPDPNTGNMRIPWDFYPSYWTGFRESYNKDQWLDLSVLQSGNVVSEYKKVSVGIDSILHTYGYERENGYYRVSSLVSKKEDTLIFFCHLGVSFVMLGHLLGISPFLLWHTAFVAPSSVTILGSEEREPGIASFRIQTLGDTKHLSAAGEPISSSGYFTDCFQY